MGGKLNDLTGQQFGDWTVLRYLGKSKWLCQCSCDENTIKVVHGYDLRSGNSKSCGHNTTKFRDLTGQIFGHLTAIKYLGNQRWMCKCDCNNHTLIDVKTYHLTSGQVKSCGCATSELFRQTMYSRYGDISSTRIKNARTYEQLSMVKDRKSLEEAVKFSFKEKPSLLELSNLLNMSVANTSLTLHKFNLSHLIKTYSYSSHYEDDIVSYILGIRPDIEISMHNKGILHGQELDIYLPEQGLAIEFNGTYWHSSIQKDTRYHQNKTISASKNNVRLIHIFEYEWNNPDKQQLIKGLIKTIILPKANSVIHGRNIEIHEIPKTKSTEFLKEYHLQGSTSANIHIGAFYNNELIGVITFGKPRFNKEYEYELVRLAWKTDIVVTGGAQRLFKYFIQRYKPSSIVSYCDISKFTGKVYSNLGFSLHRDILTKPNYVWVDLSNNTLTRYQTMKQSLISKGYGDLGATEDEIMHALGYFKIYDCGNLKFEWKRKA